MLDLQIEYFHITVKHDYRHKTAFILPWLRFQCKMLPLWLLGAPFWFTEAMVSISSDLPFLVVYFDDMLIFSESTKQHL